MDYTGRAHVDTSPDALFDFLANVRNLPRYFSRMTSVEPGDGEQVRTTAQLPDGRTVERLAWLRVSMTERALAWGSEGPSDYNGRLEVHASGDGAEIQLQLHTGRADDPRVQKGIDDTLAEVRRLVESGAAVR